MFFPSIDEVVEILDKLKMRIKVVAIPETLDYLLKGGRLSRKEWLIGSILKIKPIIALSQTGVKVVDKKIGTKKAVFLFINFMHKNTNVKIPPKMTIFLCFFDF